MTGVKAILLLALAGSVSAGPAHKPSRSSECKPAGGLLFEIAQRADHKAKLTTATTRLYENGSWKTQVLDVDGKLMRTHAGCLNASDVTSIRASLRSAKWRTTRTDTRCRADQPRFTLYKWKGRLLYTERTCNIDVLDDESQKALDLVEFYLRAPTQLDGGAVPQECLSNPLAKGCD